MLIKGRMICRRLVADFRLSIKWLKRASSKEIPCLNKFYKIYKKHFIHFSSPPKKLTLFEDPEIKLTFLASLVKGAGLRWRPLHKVQKHRPNRQGKRWVQLVALGGIEKRAWTQCPSSFWRFLFFVRGSELCEAQETRGSKFIYEFGRNSTVYCFVASENKTAPAHKRQNLPNFLEIYLRCLPFTFCV